MERRPDGALLSERRTRRRCMPRSRPSRAPCPPAHARGGLAGVGERCTDSVDQEPGGLGKRSVKASATLTCRFLRTNEIRATLPQLTFVVSRMTVGALYRSDPGAIT